MPNRIQLTPFEQQTLAEYNAQIVEAQNRVAAARDSAVKMLLCAVSRAGGDVTKEWTVAEGGVLVLKESDQPTPKPKK